MSNTDPRQTLPRVAFFANALLPGYRSSQLIGERLRDLGRDWPKKGENPGFIRWFSFPVHPPFGSGARPVWVDFYIIPVFGPQLLREPSAYDWIVELAEHTIKEAKADGVPLTIGWGAYTKIPTKHGERPLSDPRLRELLAGVSTTHGDAGTSWFIDRMVREAKFRPGFRAAVVGANGAIGDLVAKVLPRHQPSEILFVGKEDEPGKTDRRDRLNALAAQVQLEGGDIVVSQDKQACALHDSDLVIVATRGDEPFLPSQVRQGSLVLDITTPAACRREDGWEGRLVLSAGCGQIKQPMLQDDFGEHRGSPLIDVGAGGDHTLWGCTLETIAWAMYGRTGHVTGSKIPLEEFDWCAEHLLLLGFQPQHPSSFDKVYSWDDVRDYVRNSSPPRRRTATPASAHK